MSCGQSGKKKALLIGIGYAPTRASPLKRPHEDTKALREFLINTYGYNPEDITLMTDDGHLPNDHEPTRKQILLQIDNLVRNPPENGQFFFYYSGHGLEDCHSSRADRRDDEIVSADEKPIFDHIIYDRLVPPLENVKGSKLFALFDCCHSETLLDLKQRDHVPHSHSWCVNIGQVAKGFFRIHRRLVHGAPLEWPRESSYQWKGRGTKMPVLRENISTRTRKDVQRSRHIRHLHEIERLKQSERLKLQQVEPPRQFSVICLAACSDTYIDRDLTFTKCFLDAARARPNMTWVELREELKHLTSVRYTEVSLNTPERVRDVHINYTREPRYSATPNVDLTQSLDF